MPNWLAIILIIAIVGGIIGFFSGNEGERGASAFAGALSGALGCGFLIFQVFLFGLSIVALVALFGFLFG